MRALLREGENPTNRFSDSAPSVTDPPPMRLNKRFSQEEVAVRSTMGDPSVDLAEQKRAKHMWRVKRGRRQNDMTISWLETDPVKELVVKLIKF